MYRKCTVYQGITHGPHINHHNGTQLGIQTKDYMGIAINSGPKNPKDLLKKRRVRRHNVIVCPRERTKGRCFLTRVYALPFLQWLLRTISAYSSPGCPTVLEVKEPIPQSASASVVGCSSEDVIMPQGVFPKHSSFSMGFKLGETVGVNPID
ncbi:hypothetical protein TNCV_604521 [Trichonephila clavipes]|nr:hypothetical protein TNCV_604521 [Trichonephila clavipes]